MEQRYEVIKNWDTKKVIAGLHVKKPITDNVNQFITNLIKVEFPWLQFITKRWLRTEFKEKTTFDPLKLR